MKKCLQEDKKEIRNFVQIEFEEEIDGDGIHPEDSLGDHIYTDFYW